MTTYFQDNMSSAGTNWSWSGPGAAQVSGALRVGGTDTSMKLAQASMRPAAVPTVDFTSHTVDFQIALRVNNQGVDGISRWGILVGYTGASMNNTSPAQYTAPAGINLANQASDSSILIGSNAYNNTNVVGVWQGTTKLGTIGQVISQAEKYLRVRISNGGSTVSIRTETTPDPNPAGFLLSHTLARPITHARIAAYNYSTTSYWAPIIDDVLIGDYVPTNLYVWDGNKWNNSAKQWNGTAWVSLEGSLNSQWDGTQWVTV